MKRVATPGGARTLLALVLAAQLCAGCDYIPATDAYKQARAERLAAGGLIDPSSAQFRNVAVHGDTVCGEVNGKNRMGAYVGYTRFLADVAAGEAQLDPEFDPSTLSSAEGLCASMLRSSYGSTSSACEMAAEERLKKVVQTQFDGAWQRQCGVAVGEARGSFRPTLEAPAGPRVDADPLEEVEAAADAALNNAAAALDAADEAITNADAAVGFDEDWVEEPSNHLDELD